ncbi:MAG: hypothetical protein ACLQG3_01640 [Terracidiphilus sp.]
MLLLLVGFSAFANAQKYRAWQPPPKPYPSIVFPLSVHISAIRVRTECGGTSNCGNTIYVDAILNGKKIELVGSQYYHLDREQARFAMGDYKARALKDATHKDGPHLGQKYEIVVADGTFWPCVVTGLFE